MCCKEDPPLPPLKRGENSVKVPVFKGDLGGSPGLKTRPSLDAIVLKPFTRKTHESEDTPRQFIAGMKSDAANLFAEFPLCGMMKMWLQDTQGFLGSKCGRSLALFGLIPMAESAGKKPVEYVSYVLACD